MTDEDKLDGADGEISKSERKRQADAITTFAATLVEQSAHRLKRLPLDDVLREAIASCPPRSTRGAYKRHIQFISKQIRKAGNFEELQNTLDKPGSKPNPHQTLCNQLIESFTDHVDTLRVNYPLVSLQQARQLALAAGKFTPPTEPEQEDTKTRAAKKKAEKAKDSLLKLLTEAGR